MVLRTSRGKDTHSGQAEQRNRISNEATWRDGSTDQGILSSRPSTREGGTSAGKQSSWGSGRQDAAQAVQPNPRSTSAAVPPSNPGLVRTPETTNGTPSPLPEPRSPGRQIPRCPKGNDPNVSPRKEEIHRLPLGSEPPQRSTDTEPALETDQDQDEEETAGFRAH